MNKTMNRGLTYVEPQSSKSYKTQLKTRSNEFRQGNNLNLNWYWKRSFHLRQGVQNEKSIKYYNYRLVQNRYRLDRERKNV